MIDATLTVAHVEALSRTLDASLTATRYGGRWHVRLTPFPRNQKAFYGAGHDLLSALAALIEEVARVVDGSPGEAA